MTEKKHLSGLRAKMAARDERHKSPRNSSPTGKRHRVPALPKPKPIGKAAHVERMGRRAERRASTHEALKKSFGDGSGPPLNRHTGKPHKHSRELARNRRRKVGGWPGFDEQV